jgi:hypothetical protein
MHENDPTRRDPSEVLATLLYERRAEALALFPGGPRRAASLLARAAELPTGTPEVMRHKLVGAAGHDVERMAIDGWPQFSRGRAPFAYAKLSLAAASDELLGEFIVQPEDARCRTEPSGGVIADLVLPTTIAELPGVRVRVVESDFAIGERQRVMAIASAAGAYVVVLHLWRGSLEHVTSHGAYAIAGDEVHVVGDEIAIAAAQQAYDPLDYLDLGRGLAAVNRRVYTRRLVDPEWRWQPTDPHLAGRTPALAETIRQLRGHLPPHGYNDLQVANWYTADESCTVVLPIDGRPVEAVVTWHGGHGPLAVTNDGLECMPEVVDPMFRWWALYPDLSTEQQAVAQEMGCGATAGLSDGGVLLVGDDRWAVVSREGAISHPTAVTLGGFRMPLVSTGR